MGDSIADTMGWGGRPSSGHNSSQVDWFTGQAGNYMGEFSDLMKNFNTRGTADYKSSQDALALTKAAAEGNAPSAAQGVLQKGLDQGISAQMAMANSASPSQSMGAQKRALDNAAMMTQDTANQASVLRANEMATARQAYNSSAQALYAQNTAAAQGYGGMRNDSMSAAMGTQAAMFGDNIKADANATSSITSAVSGAIGGFKFSDKKLKKDIHEPTEEDIDQFLEAVRPMLYKYKDPSGAHGKTPGKHLGIIAQELEKTNVGKSLVVDTPQGKAIDLPSTVGTLLATSARMHDRLSSLESYLKKTKETKGK